jgi:dTDP-4-dehydrorhamnose reductase
MKALITGMHGTVAPVLAAELQHHGHQVIAWDREQVPIDKLDAIRQFVGEQQPDWFCHIATGSPDWAEAIAGVCAEQQIPLLFTSSVSVFGPEQRAPLTPDLMPAPTDDYGRYKRECEERMAAAHDQIIIARLAWQIGDEPGSNTMVQYIDQQVREQGQLLASTNWYPACAFLADTAAELYRLMSDAQPGMYHLDGNPGLSFYEIACGLKTAQRRDWAIIPTDAPVFDNRMRDQRIAIRPITEGLARSR